MSIGRRKIEKVATFDFNSEDNIFAFYFGDLKVDGTVDYEVRSNNGDIYEVLATIVSIIKEFLDEHPGITVFFTGNTPNRILLYHRMLKTKYSNIKGDYIVTAIIQIKGGLLELHFDPFSTLEWRGFYIRKNQLTLKI